MRHSLTQQLQQKLLSISKDLIEVTDCSNKHFSFLLDKTKIVSVGWNTSKTHPLASEYGYRFDATHSELSALLRYKGDKSDLKRLSLINLRINSLGEVGYSKPCEKCLPWLSLIEFKAIWYTDRNGAFVKL